MNSLILPCPTCFIDGNENPTRDPSALAAPRLRMKARYVVIPFFCWAQRMLPQFVVDPLGKVKDIDVHRFIARSTRLQMHRGGQM